MTEGRISIEKAATGKHGDIFLQSAAFCGFCTEEGVIDRQRRIVFQPLEKARMKKSGQHKKHGNQWLALIGCMTFAGQFYAATGKYSKTAERTEAIVRRQNRRIYQLYENGTAKQTYRQPGSTHAYFHPVTESAAD